MAHSGLCPNSQLARCLLRASTWLLYLSSVGHNSSGYLLTEDSIKAEMGPVFLEFDAATDSSSQPSSDGGIKSVLDQSNQ